MKRIVVLFGSGTEALAYAKAAGWAFEGRAGLFRRYARYRGLLVNEVEPDGKSDIRILRLHVYDNGSTKLFSSTDEQTSLPPHVWRSADIYTFTKFMKYAVNGKLNAAGSGILVGTTKSPSCFELVAENGREIGEIAFPTAALTHPLNRLPMEEGEMTAFANQKHAEYITLVGRQPRQS